MSIWRDDLAEDSEDDKKICSAQARAAARKKKSGIKSVPKSKPYQARRPMASPANLAYMPSYANHFCGPIRHNTPYTRPFNPTYQSGPKSTDFCFSCGKTGHWRRNCPGYSPKMSKDGHAVNGINVGEQNKGKYYRFRVLAIFAVL